MTEKQRKAREALDAWVREVVAWHFDPATGCPFWLARAKDLGFDPRKEIQRYDDLDRFGSFEDEWLRGGPVQRWVPKGLAGKPVYVFETGGSTGVPKSRISVDDFRIDYEMYSQYLPDASFPKGADWLHVGPSGPRRLRLAIEHLCQYRGGICFMVDLDPRWVIKLIKRGQIEEMERYKGHVIDQALTLLRAHPNIRCLFITPKLLEALCEKISLKKAGITGVFCGGTEMTPQFHRFAVEELLEGAHFQATYGNTLMGLAAGKPRVPEDNWAIIYYPPSPRAMIEVVDPDDPTKLVDYGKTGRTRLTTLTKEFFMPRFLERDECEREPPTEQFPWDGVRNVRPFSRFQATVVEGVYLSLLHIPILRKGRPYKSIDVARPLHQRTREPFVEISQANSGLIRRDLLDQPKMSAPLRERSVRELIALTQAAARHFAEDALPLGDTEQTPQQYIEQVSGTTGLPYTLVRRSRDRVKNVLERVEQVLSGLSRGLDLEVLDRGLGESGGHALSYIPRADALGIVLPSNAPGVHALWVPAIALKTALVLKPGSAEPWTPYRLIQAFLKAGAPPEAFGYYPADHAGGGEILRRCGRGAVFGDVASTSRWLSDPRIEVHGPGYSKVLLGPDQAERWMQFVDVMAGSIAENSGRSCMCASGIWTTAHAVEIADALADRLVQIVPRATEDEQAALAPFADPRVAERISKQIDELLRQPGARDITAEKRQGARCVTWNGGSYLLPTIVLVDDPDHPLANREFLFPFAAVVPVRAEEVPERLGPTLALTALTEDPPLVKRLLASPLVNRLNLGPVSTMQIAWDQPHEGNLFEHLYVRRALQRASA